MDPGWHEILVKAALPWTGEPGDLSLRLEPGAAAQSPPLLGASVAVRIADALVRQGEQPGEDRPQALRLGPGGDESVRLALPAMPAGRYDLWLHYRARGPATISAALSTGAIECRAAASGDEWRWFKAGRVLISPDQPIAFAAAPVGTPPPGAPKQMLRLTHVKGWVEIDSLFLSGDGLAPADAEP
jgi:hypothetical protein